MKNYLLLALGLVSLFCLEPSYSFAELLNRDTGRLLFVEENDGQFYVFEKDKLGDIKQVTTQAISEDDLRKSLTLWPKRHAINIVQVGAALGQTFSSINSFKIEPSYDGLYRALFTFIVFEFAENIGKERRLNKLTCEKHSEISNSFYQKVLIRLDKLEQKSASVEEPLN